MNGLLNRLAGQAMGSRVHGAPSRIRAAMSVHTRAPLAVGGNESAGAEPDLELPAPAGHTAPTPGPSTPADEELAVETTAVKIIPPQPTGHDMTTNVAPRVRSPRRANAPARDATTSEPRAASPATLLPEAPPPAQTLASIPQPARESRGLTGPQTTAAEAITEVHVHIGRIDVIAAPENEAPKKLRAPVSRPTLPLADYLARRKRS